MWPLARLGGNLDRSSPPVSNLLQADNTFHGELTTMKQQLMRADQAMAEKSVRHAHCRLSTIAIMSNMHLHPGQTLRDACIRPCEQAGMREHEPLTRFIRAAAGWAAPAIAPSQVTFSQTHSPRSSVADLRTGVPYKNR